MLQFLACPLVCSLPIKIPCALNGPTFEGSTTFKIGFCVLFFIVVIPAILQFVEFIFVFVPTEVKSLLTVNAPENVLIPFAYS